MHTRHAFISKFLWQAAASHKMKSDFCFAITIFVNLTKYDTENFHFRTVSSPNAIRVVHFGYFFCLIFSFLSIAHQTTLVRLQHLFIHKYVCVCLCFVQSYLLHILWKMSSAHCYCICLRFVLFSSIN